MNPKEKTALKTGFWILFVLAVVAVAAMVGRDGRKAWLNDHPPENAVQLESARRASLKPAVTNAATNTVEAVLTNALPTAYVEKLADAIFWSEGGLKTKYPYGVMGRKWTLLNRAEARQYCINTINNSYARYLAAVCPGPYLEFLGNRYCPEEVDPIGYRNWLVNVRWFLENPKPAVP